MKDAHRQVVEDRDEDGIDACSIDQIEGGEQEAGGRKTKKEKEKE